MDRAAVLDFKCDPSATEGALLRMVSEWPKYTVKCMTPTKTRNSLCTYCMISVQYQCFLQIGIEGHLQPALRPL